MENHRYKVAATLLALLTLWMLRDFLPGIVWAAILAVSLWPVYERFRAWCAGRISNPALPFLALFLVLVMLPLAYLFHTAAGLYGLGSALLAHDPQSGIPLPAVFDSLPFHEQVADFWNQNVATSGNLIDALNQLSQGHLTGWLSAALLQISSVLFSALCMLVTLYYLLLHGPQIRAQHEAVVDHWFGAGGVQAVGRAVLALRGTINGIVLVGLVEGALLALPLMAAGVRSGLLIGMLAGIFGVIPLVTPALILPCAGYLYLTGHTGWAVLTLAVLALAWIVFENLIKPRIISAAVRVNPFLVLAGLIGGLQLLGPVGLFLGPALVSLCAGLAQELWRSR